eukprot:1528643-Rhodomonas_salina.1
MLLRMFYGTELAYAPTSCGSAKRRKAPLTLPLVPIPLHPKSNTRNRNLGTNCTTCILGTNCTLVQIAYGLRQTGKCDTEAAYGRGQA